VKVNWVVNN